MDKYKQFHIDSSLCLETSNQFSTIAAWIVGMRNFSKELTFKVSEYWGKRYSLKEYERSTSLPIETLLSKRRSNRTFTFLGDYKNRFFIHTQQ